MGAALRRNRSFNTVRSKSVAVRKLRVLVSELTKQIGETGNAEQEKTFRTTRTEIQGQIADLLPASQSDGSDTDERRRRLIQRLLNSSSCAQECSDTDRDYS